VVAFSQLGTLQEREPGRYTGVDDGRGTDVLNVVWQRPAAGTGYNGALRHRTVGPSRRGEEYAGTIIKVANSVKSAHNRQLTKTGIV
jgi:hypothetical protein